MVEKTLLENSDPSVTNEQIQAAVRNIRSSFKTAIPISRCPGTSLFYTRPKESNIIYKTYLAYSGEIPEFPYYLRLFRGMNVVKYLEKAGKLPFNGFCVGCGEMSDIKYHNPLSRFWLEDSDFMLNALPMRRSTNPRNLWYYYNPSIRQRLLFSNSLICPSCVATMQIMPNFIDLPKEFAKLFSFVSTAFYNFTVKAKAVKKS